MILSKTKKGQHGVRRAVGGPDFEKESVFCVFHSSAVQGIGSEQKNPFCLARKCPQERSQPLRRVPGCPLLFCCQRGAEWQEEEIEKILRKSEHLSESPLVWDFKGYRSARNTFCVSFPTCGRETRRGALKCETEGAASYTRK